MITFKTKARDIGLQKPILHVPEIKRIYCDAAKLRAIDCVYYNSDLFRNVMAHIRGKFPRYHLVGGAVAYYIPVDAVGLTVECGKLTVSVSEIVAEKFLHRVTLTIKQVA